MKQRLPACHGNPNLLYRLMLYLPVTQRIVKRFSSTSLPCPQRAGNAHFATMHGDNASSTRWSIYSHYTIKCTPNNWRQSKREKVWDSRHDTSSGAFMPAIPILFLI